MTQAGSFVCLWPGSSRKACLCLVFPTDAINQSSVLLSCCFVRDFTHLLAGRWKYTNCRIVYAGRNHWTSPGPLITHIPFPPLQAVLLACVRLLRACPAVKPKAEHEVHMWSQVLRGATSSQSCLCWCSPMCHQQAQSLCFKMTSLHRLHVLIPMN